MVQLYLSKKDEVKYLKDKTRIIILLIAVLTSYILGNVLNVVINKTPKEENIISVSKTQGKAKELVSAEELKPVIAEEKVYNDLTLNELADKLNRSLNSTISNQGYLIASYALEKGVDPYLAVAIMLHETGCKWECSKLVKSCNNVGGQKGSPSCGNGSYKRFDSLELGIKGFIDNLAKNYYAYGLTTPEAMNRKYAASTTWATKVNAYIEQIKAK